MTRFICVAFFTLAFGFSFWLMWHTFGYDSVNSQILVSDKIWSDFGSHLPLIRSFSQGVNWPIQHPLFPGELIRYHPLFYLVVGFLEKTGLRLDWALNIPSFIGFFFLLFFIYKLAQHFFSSFAVGTLSVVLFLFNGTLSFIKFFSLHPPSAHTLGDIITNSRFPSFGPWDGGPVTAFWNLNIFTNQRHLAPSFALALFVIYYLHTARPRLAYLTGFFLGIFLLLNHAVFAILLLFIFWYFLTRRQLRFPLVVSLLGILPWWLLFLYTIQLSPGIVYKFGYLTPPPVNWFSFLSFWYHNLGLHILLIPFGFFLAPRSAKILIFPLIILFILPNFFQFSPDMINNHKFFNFFMLFGVMFSSYFLFRIWHWNIKGKIIAPVFFLLVTLSGLIDFFPVYHDRKISLADVPANRDAAYILSSTPPDAVILNSTWFYHPASIAGRKIFNGYSYFTWSYGYDQADREKRTQSIYGAATKVEACRLLNANGISYVELQPHPEGFLRPNWKLWDEQFLPAYVNPQSSLRIYSVTTNCQPA